jgi:hypothetical protein
MVAGGSGRETQGDFHGKLSRLIQRLENKRTDRRLGFLFQGSEEMMKFEWLDELVVALLAGTKDQADKKGGVKIIDFSEVPSDILPLIVSLVAKLAFSVQQWTLSENAIQSRSFATKHICIYRSVTRRAERRTYRWKSSSGLRRRGASTESASWLLVNGRPR